MSREHIRVAIVAAAWLVAAYLIGTVHGRHVERVDRPGSGVFRVMDAGQIVSEWVVPAGGGVEVRAVDLPKPRPLTLPPHHCGEGE